MTQETLPMVVYWHENQIAITFRSSEALSTHTENVIASLHLDLLKQFLAENGFTLKTFQEQDLLRLPQPSNKGSNVGRRGNQTGTTDSQKPDDINNPAGKYIFISPGGKGTSIVCFFHVTSMSEQSTWTSYAQAGTPGGNEDQYGYATGETAPPNDYYANDVTIKAVCLLNQHLDALKGLAVPIVSAMPNWLKGGTVECTTHGCPIAPPVPVDAGSISGRWKIILPTQLATPLSNADGTGVTVLVLDTLRSYIDVSAVEAANNSLLQDIVKNVTFNYNDLPDVLDIPNPEQPGTGKDVYGRLIGFPIADHGIFVAGIVRDLAPGAHVECIRVLNDFGVGNTTGLMHALEHIQNRLLHVEGAGSPLNLPLVVNLSLVGTPSDAVLLEAPYNLDQTQIYQLREGWYEAIQSLTSQGVVFVAAAGNDSDLRDSNSSITLSDGTTAPKRFGPRYPAAFAYDESAPGQPTRSGIPTMIPVGAVNQAGNAASYSNYPGTVGIATYGGELLVPEPKEAPPTPPPAPPYGSPTKIVGPIDGVRGVYTSPLFPAPSMDDRLAAPSPQPPNYPEYAPASPTTWAYWSGTSFATPIISALAARVLQNQASTQDSVRQALLAAIAQKPLWTGLNAQSNEATPGSVIMVSQEYVSD